MSSIRRFAFDELPVSVAERLEARVKRLGYLGEFFRCAAHQPDALAAFIDFTEAGKDALPNNLVELIALTCAIWMGNDYERNQHEQLCLKLGLTKYWVGEVNSLSPETAKELSAVERQVQRLVLTILETKGTGAPALIDALVDVLGDAQAIAVLMVVGRYVVHALIVNSLALIPPVPSIFDDTTA